MTIFSKRDDERRSGRADSRKSKRNRLFWMEASESPRLEPRTLMTVTVTNFPIPLVEIVKPDGITTGSDGNLWFTENASGQVGRMTPAGVVTQFALPSVPPPAGSPAGTAATTPNPTAITAGPDGALWFIGIPGEIGRITTAGVVTEFPLPVVPPPAGSSPGTASTPATATAIVSGPDGALWFTGVPGEVGRISTTGVVTEFAVLEIPPPAGSSPGTAGTLATLTSITAGPDGALWFTGVPGEVGRITTAGVVTEFAVPVGTSGTPATLTSITKGPDGALWFTGVSGEVGRITTAGVVTEYPTPNFNPPSNGIVTTITTGPDGSLWLTGQTAIGRITPTGTFTSFDVPGKFNTIAGLTSGPGGNLWFTEQEDGKTVGEQPAVGEITPAGVTKLYALPQGTTLDPNLGVPADPTAITTGPDGALWFGENGAIGRITTAGTIQVFPLAPTATVPDITQGSDGVLWFAEQNSSGSNSIGRITTQGAIQQFPLPTPTATIADITPGPDGALWFAEQNPEQSYSIGRITTTGAITAYPLPQSTSASVTAGPAGNVWFTETVSDPKKHGNTTIIGQITPAGQIQSFVLPPKLGKNESVGNLTLGPDGNLWFTISNGTAAAIARITARGKVKMYGIPSTGSEASYHALDPNPPTDIISGPDGKLWYQSTVDGKTGIARISTNGKLGPFIPVTSWLEGAFSGLVSLPDGQVWFESQAFGSDSVIGLGLATRSGILVTQDLPATNSSASGSSSGIVSGLTLGPDGNLWAGSPSSIVRISGLDTVAGSLDYRHRPRRAPDYYGGGYDQFSWTNVTATAHPAFAGVATPGAEVTLWVQKQGENQPVSIGQVKASTSDGSWTLKSQVKLTSGNYAVTATQTGDTGPPSVLYSLEPDSSGNLSNALVIQTRHAGK
ncbi:MAG: Ig-like domain-containing protein [Isosphaeraceae bacterium]